MKPAARFATVDAPAAADVTALVTVGVADVPAVPLACAVEPGAVGLVGVSRAAVAVVGAGGGGGGVATIVINSSFNIAIPSAAEDAPPDPA